MVDAEEDDVDGEVIQDEETGTESAVVSLGGGVRKRVTLNTHAVQQKNQAARVLYEFASALKGYLKGYILPSLQVLLAMVTDKHSSDIRSSATLALARMFEALVHAAQLGYIQDDPSRNISLDAVLSSCLSKLMESLRDEADATARACAAEALRDVLQACYQSGQEAEDVTRSGFLLRPSVPTCERVVKELLTRCAECLMRRQGKEDALRGNEGYDEEDRTGAAASLELEEEEDLLTTFADTFGQLLKLHGEPFMEEFDHFIAPAFSPYLRPDQPQGMQVVAVYLVDDVVEFGGTAAHKYIPSLLPTFVRNSTSENALLRQSSVYGLAKAILKAPSVVSAHLSSIAPCLMNLLNSAGAKQKQQQTQDAEDDEDEEEDDGEGTVENAVVALGTLCSSLEYRAALSALGAGSVQHIAALWLQRLPLKTDELQAKIACKQLCDCIERNDTMILGENGANQREILRAFAETLTLVQDGQQVAHPVTLERVKAILRGVFANVNGVNVLSMAVASLSPEQQRILSSALN